MVACSATADCAAFLDQGHLVLFHLLVQFLAGLPNARSAVHCTRDLVYRQLLFASQVRCSLIAVPECLVEADADADADVHRGRGPLYGCLVADVW